MLVIRDPLHNNIRLDPLARELIETPAFQRLRYVRQLGLAFLVYPGATHTRFEHALGTYHLARRSLALLGEEGGLASVPPDECAIVSAAALLHDLGHYPFSHALEEIGAMHHEDVARAAREFAPGGLDAALVLVNGDALQPALACVKEGGRIAFPNGVEPEPTAPEGVSLLAYDGVPSAEAFERLNALIGEERFHVELGRVYQLEDAARAHRDVNKDHLGKLALRIHPS